MSPAEIKRKTIVVKLKNLYPDDPVDRLRGRNVVAELQRRGWNIALYNNQKKIDLILYLDDYNLYDRLIYESIRAERTVIDIQDNHLDRRNPASAFIKKSGGRSRLRTLFTGLRKEGAAYASKLLIKALWRYHYFRAIREADALICSSYALGEAYAALNPAAGTIPDALVPVHNVGPVRKHERFTLCWVGTANNIAYLKLIEPALVVLQERHGTAVHVITAKTVFEEALLAEIMNGFAFEYTFIPWQASTADEEMRRCHLALAPLPAGAQKSTNKVLSYLQASLPVVASGAPDYARLSEEYPGSFVYLDNNDTAGWIEAMERVMQDRAYREALLRSAEAVVEAHGIEKIAERYEALFERLWHSESEG